MLMFQLDMVKTVSTVIYTKWAEIIPCPCWVKYLHFDNSSYCFPYYLRKCNTDWYEKYFISSTFVAMLRHYYQFKAMQDCLL